MNTYTKKTPLIKLGTRGSRLALAQAEEFKQYLVETIDIFREPGAIETVVIHTTGDKILDRPLSEVGGKGLFMKDIEKALVAGHIDAAVHSMKDVETFLNPKTTIGCILPREEVNDALISYSSESLKDLPYGSIIGTSSVRRIGLIKNQRPDLKTVLFRGNINTRLQKLDNREVDATILAVAGLRRVGLVDRITQKFTLEEIPPAIGQGAIGVQCRVPKCKADEEILNWISKVNHRESAIRVESERAMLGALDGSCQTPIAGFSKLTQQENITLKGFVISPDGTKIHSEDGTSSQADAAKLGQEIGQRLLIKAGSDLVR